MRILHCGKGHPSSKKDILAGWGVLQRLWVVPGHKPAANGEPGLRLHNGRYHAE